MRLKLTLLFLLLFGFAFCDYNNNYEGFSLLIPQHVEIPLYSFLNCTVACDYIINDTINEDYPVLAIKSIDNHKALVSVEYPMGTRKETAGWIDVEYLGVYLKSESDTLCVFELPDYDSDVAFYIINANWGRYYHVIDASDGWLKVENPEEPDETGWLAPENQSQNPYTPSC